MKAKKRFEKALSGKGLKKNQPKQKKTLDELLEAFVSRLPAPSQ